jgi:C_GCAxxG_C_C family probable redox protein
MLRSMSTHREKAVKYFLSGYNCAQSTAAAFAEECGLDADTVLMMMAGFGGGIGGLRETCGAVSAMAYVAGLQVGPYAANEIATKKRLYGLIQQMAQAFVTQHGTLCCRELLEKESCDISREPSARSADYYAARPCTRIVASAADIIAQSIQPPSGG